jgi:glycosyltransferase involved in cell wall biosynthesis
MNRVAIFRADLLPVSETFIRDQASALVHWRPVLFGLRELPGGLETPGIQREIVSSGNRVSDTLRFWLSRPNPHLVRCLKEMDIDLAHAHFGTDATDIWPSVKAAGLPMLVTLHGYDINIHREWWEAGHGGLRRRVYPRRLLRMAEDPTVHFIAVSKAIKERAIKFGIPEGKITVAYIGVDIRRFKLGGLPLEQRRKRILFVGRMVEKKAPLLMIRAFADVRRAIPDAELAMIGDGPLLSDAKRLAGDLATPVMFLGARGSDEVLAQMHEARVFCLPSVVAANGDAEGFGLALLEAQSCGVPVVSSALGGADEGLLDEITGYKFDAGNIGALVKRINALFDDSDKAARMSAAASAFAAKNFDVARLCGTLEQIYMSNSGRLVCT